jgi:SAM-dependent methyltransferase
MWSFFQKNRANEQKVAPVTTTSQTAKLHAAITPVLNTRPVAHYALVDADSDDLDDIIKNVENSPPTEEEEEEGLVFHPVEIPRGLTIRKREPSILLPSPPKLHGEFEKDDRPSPRTAMFNRNLMPQEMDTSPERPSRLTSVGRIPQVVSRRDRHHRPAMQSFSRPFSVVESPSLTVPTTQSMCEPPLAANLTASGNASDLGIASEALDWGQGFNPTFSASETTSALEFLAGPFSTYEFLKFPPKKDSTSSDSTGVMAAVTAVAPLPGSPPTEDEVWNEYDDLIDHVLSPDEPKSEETGKTDEEGRFELATLASRALQDELNSARQPQSGLGGTSVRSSGSSVHLRRSRIVSALQSSTAPSSQPSYSDLAEKYGDLNEKDELTASTEQSSSDQRRENQSTFLTSLAAVPSPRPKAHREQEASSSEHEWDAVTKANMRSASLMTSRWLSFGRVLFSPAHNHVKAGAQGRILVVDGLGNDDWSFYCSLTYPDAEVYNLGRPVSTSAPHPAAWKPPTNHHIVHHAGLGNPFPFKKDFFTVVVIRFLTVCSSSVQANIVQECKRVLRTGGYIEMSLLDRDMVNMGPATRKAVRTLKEKTCLSDPTLCLKSTSDSIQREIGAHGFDSLRRCMVRIPVAGMVLRASDSSSSTHSFSTTTPSFSLPTISITTASASASESQGTSMTPKSLSDANISLGDLLSDPSPSAANDESIAKIVARVGRWWYSKCYEDPIFPNSEIRMWDDRKLLRECQKRGTGFRMFIAYAQKPSEVPRRTASV